MQTGVCVQRLPLIWIHMITLNMYKLSFIYIKENKMKVSIIVRIYDFPCYMNLPMWYVALNFHPLSSMIIVQYLCCILGYKVKETNSDRCYIHGWHSEEAECRFSYNC